MRFRRFFPKSGPPYELFDCSVLLLVLALVGYVVTDPSGAGRRALFAPLLFAPEAVWGAALTTVALVGIVCSYFAGWIGLGFRLVMGASMFWSACFSWGLITGAGEPRVLISATLYAWIASRLWREQDRWEVGLER